MPIYEYKCRYCAKQFQKLMKLDEAKPPCPLCKCAFVDKMISQGSFVLKGSGWDKDGYGLRGKG